MDASKLAEEILDMLSCLAPPKNGWIHHEKQFLPAQFCDFVAWVKLKNKIEEVIETHENR